MILFAPLAPPKVLQPYPFQEKGIDSLRHAMGKGHRRIILCAPTGSGKSEMSIYLMDEARRKGSRSVFVADLRVLVKQTSDRLKDYGIPHGVIMAGAMENPKEKIQICSAQTIERMDSWPDLDLLVLDECHSQRKTVVEFAREWGGYVVGLTATPLTKGLGDTYTHVVNAATTDWLVAEGYLAPLHIYAAKEIDMTGAQKNSAGEWTEEEVQRRGRPIIGDIVSEWVKQTGLHFGGPVKTLLFSASVAHGEELCRAFQLAGYDFRQTSYQDSDAESERLIKGFRRGDFTGLVSVAKLTKGFDVPDVLCGIDARPNTSSLTEVVQKLGRVMRASPGKDYGLWLCHSGNMAGWHEDVCEIWANGVNRLPGPQVKKKTRREGRERQDVVCPCGFVLLPGMNPCPSCGRERRRRNWVEAVSGRMEEVTAPGSREWMQDKRWTWGQICRMALERKDGDERLAQRYAYAQYRAMYDRSPPYTFSPTSGEVDQRVERKVLRQIAKWRKNQRRGRNG